MDSFLLAHLRDLAKRTQTQEVVNASAFLDLPSQGALASFFNKDLLFGVPAFYFGGCEDAERARLVFLPSYFDQETFIQSEIASPTLIVSLRVSPLGGKFASQLSHRDYLGALMGLGIERDTFGDVRVENNEARVFALPSIAPFILENLTQVKNESVHVTTEPLFSPGFALRYEEESLSISSLRLDALLGQAYPLSRSLAKEHIEAGNVTHNGQIASRPDIEIKPGDVISLRGKGKIRLLGEEGTSRKGRIIYRIRRYL